MMRQLWAILLLLMSCQKEAIPVNLTTHVGGQVPGYFPAPVYSFSQNPVTTEGFELGRRLFYDVRLSSDNTISCASCHFQSAAFSDPGKSLSEGIEGRLGMRNSPALFNLTWHPAFMWDGGVNHIEIMPFTPLTDPNEMNMLMSELIDKLQQQTEYPELFQKAFGSSTITDQRLFYALTQFMGSMISATSKYDDYRHGTVSFTSEETAGLMLFRSHCAACHSEPLFSDFSYRNNGLASSPDDLGRERITQQATDRYKFKVPSLRNVALTYPYMHDGRFATLEEVIDHYRFGVQHSATLDPLLSGGIPLTELEKQQLIAFLHTLTDVKFTQNPRFSNPF
jgi:cytochrome c peroxidase